MKKFKPNGKKVFEGLEKDNEDLWTEVDIFHSPFMFERQLNYLIEAGFLKLMLKTITSVK